VAKRSRLADLDPNVHCSIVGTCLSTAELRRLIPRHAPHLDRKHATDLQIHHTAVELSTSGGVVAKELNKALDARHALIIRKFRAANDEQSLKRLWQEALTNGDVPGAYWALMTHPAGTFDLRTLAFGDVHMLSHLVGAANRADIRRLSELEEECERLNEQNARQQGRLHEMSSRHAAAVEELRQQAAELKQQLERPAASPQQLLEEVAQLRAALADRDQKLALHTGRRNETEQRLLAEQQRHALLQASAQQALDEAATAQRELRALEQAFMHTMQGDAERATLPQLDGKCVLYVGGRPGTTAVLSQLVSAAGGELLAHDGGLEDRRGLLATMLPRAQLVVFPVDFISHNAMHVTKQTCARYGIACHPIRSASVASFVELMQRLHAQAEEKNGS
jgi:phosphoglycolate phosphatase-like HAD superfamily hydrolase